ncbi:MAG: iron ABC transporter permease [Methanobacteriaceae archaeon]|nr:iron ABC transporter permease [Methanobacteriaceae archaeon]
MNNDINSKYKKYIRSKYYVGIVLFIILTIISIISIKIGALNLSWNDIFLCLFNRNMEGSAILWNLRIPRLVVAIIVGCCMGIEGCIMQSILRNPLASPYTMGISQGAGFGVAFSIVVLGAGSLSSASGNIFIMNNPYLTSLFAFLGAMIGVLLIVLLSRLRNITPTAMILSGVAMSSLFSAGTMLLQYFADSAQLSTIVFWTFGDVERAVWNDAWIMLLVFVPCLIYFMYHVWDYNSLESGEETAKGLGINTNKLRMVSLLVASLTAAISVSFVGVIGFIGLIAPHVMRRIIGVDHRFLILYSAILGAIILILADIISRIIIPPIIIPVGILTAFLGVPVFLYVLIKTGN